MTKITSQLARMDRSERAKQFMPFKSLKGYEEALRAKEAEVEARAKGEPGDKVEDVAPDSSDS